MGIREEFNGINMWEICSERHSIVLKAELNRRERVANKTAPFEAPNEPFRVWRRCAEEKAREQVALETG